MPDKPVTVRLRETQLRELMGIAVIENTNLAELLRTAVDEFIDRRLEDPALTKKVEAARQRQESVLDALTRV